MHARMVTLSVEDSHARVSLGQNRLEMMCVNTLRSRARTILNTFGNYYTIWIQRQLSPTSGMSPNTVTGCFESRSLCTDLENETRFYLETLMDEMRGMSSLVSDLMDHF